MVEAMRRTSYDARHTRRPAKRDIVPASLGSTDFRLTEHRMNHRPDPSSSAARIPLGQRLFDNIFLLLAAGLVVVFVLYTGWGLWEIVHLPAARLP